MHLLVLGYGYSAQTVARMLAPMGWDIVGTTRSDGKAQGMLDAGVAPLVNPDDDALGKAVRAASHILVSAAPGEFGDPFLPRIRKVLTEDPPHWIGYLSTTGVYGDHDGGWVDETTPCNPSNTRGKWRLAAETEWVELGAHAFRLAGIYGPGRGPFAKVRAGTARQIIKKNQVFGRIHVDDIAQCVVASIAKPNPGRIYNVCDDLPARPQDVLSFAAELLGVTLPPPEPFETAEMTPMARSFYAESRRVHNTRIKEELGVELRFPDYQTGLRALLNDEFDQGRL